MDISLLYCMIHCK